MTSRMKNRTWLGLGLLLLATACDDKSETTPPDASVEAGRGGNGGKGSAGKAGGAGKGGASGGAAGDGEDAGESPADAGKDASVSCQGDKGCYSCEPKEPEQFLNRCTDSQCEAFDNEKRLPLYNHGDLPKLP